MIQAGMKLTAGGPAGGSNGYSHSRRDRHIHHDYNTAGGTMNREHPQDNRPAHVPKDHSAQDYLREVILITALRLIGSPGPKDNSPRDNRSKDNS